MRGRSNVIKLNGKRKAQTGLPFLAVGPKHTEDLNTTEQNEGNLTACMRGKVQYDDPEKSDAMSAGHRYASKQGVLWSALVDIRQNVAYFRGQRTRQQVCVVPQRAASAVSIVRRDGPRIRNTCCFQMSHTNPLIVSYLR